MRKYQASIAYRIYKRTFRHVTHEISLNIKNNEAVTDSYYQNKTYRPLQYKANIRHQAERC
jgi:hypothetical protein